MDPFLTEEWDDVTTSFDEHFSTAPLDDDVLVEEQIPDRCLASTKDLTNQTTSVPTHVHMSATPPSGLTYYNQPTN